MNDSLSIWSLIANAGLVVQAVMLILLLASVVSWGMVVQRFLFFTQAGRDTQLFEDEFWSGVDLAQLYRRGSETITEGGNIGGLEAIFRAGFKDFSRMRQQGTSDPDVIMEAAQRSMRVALNREEKQLEKHLSFLATVGSTSPYIGLFGTVWGIMNSFRGLANVQQATLAVVAPGISEALIATAMGLFAAIPAVIAYNRFANRADDLLSHYQTFSDEFSSVLHRQAHLLQTAQPSAAETEESPEKQTEDQADD
ncbi:MAG: protein TolQ [Pseudomonadales bacterium]